jgi:hypothetical protein
MMTNVTGFILMTVAAICLVFAVGSSAITPATTAFVAGMYFGILLTTKKKDE